MLNDFLMPRGRPPKSDEEKLTGHHIKFPPELWKQLEVEVPKQKRASFIRRAVEDALKRLVRAKQKGGDQ